MTIIVVEGFFQGTGATHEEDLSDLYTEFGTIHSGFGGRPYRYNYAATDEPGWFVFNGLVKHGTVTGAAERYQFEPGVFCSEVGVAPRVGGTEEDDAYLDPLTVLGGSPVARIAAGHRASPSRAGKAPAPSPETRVGR